MDKKDKIHDHRINGSLICAVREGDLETVRELIHSFGVSYSKAWSEGYVLLRDAIKHHRTEIAKLLLTNDAKVNNKSKKPCNTPLHFAVINSNTEIVKMLLDRHANINSINKDGITPLHNAIQNGKIEITKLLLQRGANVNARDKSGRSALHVVVESTHVNCMCSLTLKKYCSRQHHNVDKNRKEIIKLLLSRGVNIDIKTKDGVTPLHIAAMKGYVRTAEDLLNHGADIHSVCTSTYKGYTPLHFASAQGSKETVTLFLSRGADVNANVRHNLTPLHTAIKRGHKAIVKLLLEHGAEVDALDENGETILCVAVKKGYSEIIKQIIKYFPDINNKINKSSFKTAVHHCGEEYKKIVDTLLQYGFTVSPEDVNEIELFHTAVEKGYLKIVEDLLKYGADVNILHNSISKKGYTPLHSAVKNTQGEMINLLINYGANINAKAENKMTPLFCAIENIHLRFSKFPLYRGANKTHSFKLSTAVMKEYKEIFENLIQHGADINASDECGITALHFTTLIVNKSFSSKNPDIDVKRKMTELLLSKGANVNAKTKADTKMLHTYSQATIKSGTTPLHLSAEQEDEVITKILLNKGADVNAKREDGITALHIAAKKNFLKIVEILLEFGADTDLRDEHGETALHAASVEYHERIIVALLKYGSDINIVNKNNYTPITLANFNLLNNTVDYDNDYDDDDDDDDSDYDDADDYDDDGDIEGDDDDYDYYDYDDYDYDYYNYNYDYDYNYYHAHPINYFRDETVEIFNQEIIKMKTANLYVSRENLLSLQISKNDEINNFTKKCEEEIERMKEEKISDTNVSFHDILTKNISHLAVYARNENIVQVLKSDVYKMKFPIYASMINNYFRKGVERKKLVEQGHKCFHYLFNNIPELPYNCNEKIISYLSAEDLKVLIDITM